MYTLLDWLSRVFVYARVCATIWLAVLLSLCQMTTAFFSLLCLHGEAKVADCMFPAFISVHSF